MNRKTKILAGLGALAGVSGLAYYIFRKAASVQECEWPLLFNGNILYEDIIPPEYWKCKTISKGKVSAQVCLGSITRQDMLLSISALGIRPSHLVCPPSGTIVRLPRAVDLGVIILSRPSAPIGLEEVDRIFKHPAFRKTIHVLLKKARKSITTSYLACEPIMPARDCLLYKFAIDVVRRYNTNDELEIFFGPPLDWTSVKSGVISPQLNIDIAVRSILSCKCDEEVEPIYRGLYSVARLYHRLVGRNVHGRKE